MPNKEKLDIKQVARAYFDAIAKRDLDGMAAVWKPGSTDHMVGMQELSVPEGLREWFGALFAACPDFALEVVDLVVEGEHAAVRWRATGTFDGSGRFEGLVPTGESIDITGFDLLTVRDGQIEHNEAYVNGMELARQLGALPAQDSMQERAMLGAVNLRTKAAARLRRA
jgi:predicted ester cyclase